MDNFNVNTGYAEETGWQQLSQPVYEGDVSEDSVETEISMNTQKQKNKHVIFSPVITFQLTVCLIFITLMFLGKAFMPVLFKTVMDAYSKEITTSMYFTGDFSSIDYSDLFTATNDEV